jgi:putative transposase
VPARLSPVERIRAEIDELFASKQDLGQVLEEVARLSVRLVMQAAVDAEVSEFLGRDRYARGDRERAGYRNGHAELTIKTTAGPVVLERPKLRGTDQPFTSRLLGKGVSRTNALEALVLSGFVRGLSVRDVEAALAEALGPEAALSKSTLSRVCEQVKTEFDAWTHRDLGGIELEDRFLDGSHLRMHPDARPSRCGAPGASPPRAVRCWSGWHLGPAKATTPGPASWARWWTAGWGRRCW